MKFELGQKWLCKDNYIMDSKEIGFQKGNVYEVLNCWNKGQSASFKSEVFDTHEMSMKDCEFLEYFELNNPAITIPLS